MRRNRFPVAVCHLLLALILLPAALAAQPFPETKKIVAPNAATFAQHGWSVAIDGTTLVVGAKSQGTSSNGSVYVYELDEGGAGNWGFVAQIPFPGGGFGVDFGASVGISGGTLVVGAPFDDSIQGAAYVFERDQGGAGAWGQVQKLKAFDVDDGDLFGFSVAISGDTIVVGEFLDDVGLSSSGSAYIFERDTGNGNMWNAGPRLNASDLAFDDELGGAVAISGNTVVVGAAGKNGDTGAAYVFERDQGGANAWGQAVKLTASDSLAGNLFGRSVAIDGDTLVVGGPRNDDACLLDPNCNSGSAYVFERNPDGVTWSEILKLAAVAAQGDEFGDAVAVEGDTIVVGVRFDDDAAGNAGAAYVFSRNEGGASNWGELTKLTAGGGAANAILGWSVAAGSGALFVGAPGDTSSTGAAYVFGTATAPTPPPPPPPPPGNPMLILVPGDVPTISAAINAAISGDTIQIAPGTYNENLSILAKGITLRGEDCMTTVIDGSGGAILQVDAEDVEFSCLTFRNGPTSAKGSVQIEPSASHATNGSAITIADCFFEGQFGRNVYVNDPFCHGCSDRFVFERNTVFQAGGTNGLVGIGLLLDDVSGAVVRENTFLGFPFNQGPINLLTFQASHNLLIENNVFDGANFNTIFNSAITAYTWGSRGNSEIAIVGNTFSNVPTPNSSAIYIEDGNTAHDNGAFAIVGNTFETPTLNAVIHGTDLRGTAADLAIDLSANNFLGTSSAQERENLIHHQCTAAGGLFVGQAGLACQPFNGLFGDDSAFNLLIIEHSP